MKKKPSSRPLLPLSVYALQKGASMPRSLALALICTAAFAQDWPFYGGNQAGSRYSPLDRINRANVAQLKVAWEWKPGEAAFPEFKTAPGNFEATPLMIDG